MIEEAYAEGIRRFGENKPQELRDKYEEMEKDIKWHMIGHLQRNKVKYVVGRAALIHSVDSVRLAEAIDQEAEKKGIVMPVLVEVNVASEESKFGVRVEECADFIENIAKMEHISVEGLMTIAPFVENAEDNRKYFLDDEMDDFEEEAPKKRFFKKQNEEDDLGDLDMDEKVPSGTEKSKAKSFQKSGSTSSPRPYSTSSAKTSNSGKISQMRTTKKSVAGMEVCVIKPRSMEDTREITDTLLANCTVVLNMEGLDVDIAQRIIDFSSGSCYAIDGNLQKVSNFIFIITPSGVEVSGDFQEILNGVDMPSLGNKF